MPSVTASISAMPRAIKTVSFPCRIRRWIYCAASGRCIITRCCCFPIDMAPEGGPPRHNAAGSRRCTEDPAQGGSSVWDKKRGSVTRPTHSLRLASYTPSWVCTQVRCRFGGSPLLRGIGQSAGLTHWVTLSVSQTPFRSQGSGFNLTRVSLI